MISRRRLLAFAGALFYVLTFGKVYAMSRIFRTSRKKSDPRISVNRFRAGGKTLVGVAGGKDPERMIREAVDLIGGFGALEIRGKKVLVKPNIVSGEPNPATTNPDVVGSVVRILYAEGASRVYVGDMSAMMTLSTKRNMRRNGIWQAAEKEGAQIVVFEDHGWMEVGLQEAKYIDKAYVTEWLYNVDTIINLPVIKTHRSAVYSICLKNFIGCTHLTQRPYVVDSAHWEELVAEFNLACAPDLNIVDGTVSMIAGGPWEGTPAETELIIASGDRVAADIVGLGIIKSFGQWERVVDKDVWSQRQIIRAMELGLGSAKEEIRLLAAGGDEQFLRLMDEVKKFASIQ